MQRSFFPFLKRYQQNFLKFFQRTKKVSSVSEDPSGLGDSHKQSSRAFEENADYMAALKEFSDAEQDQAQVILNWTSSIMQENQRPALTGDSHRDLKELIQAIYRISGLFDATFYRRKYMCDIPVEAAIGPLEHFMLYGRYNGNNPNAYFDYLGYLINHPDVRKSGIDPCLHFTWYGWKESRDPGAGFDANAYLKQNGDIAAAGISPFQHFMMKGRGEGRDPLPKPTSEATRPHASQTTAFGGGSGTIILVSHDSGVGGAQKVVQSYAKWIRDSTSYDVRLVTMRGGGLMHEFIAIGPTFNIEDHAPETVAEALETFCGPDVRAIFLNSVSSGGFLNHWAVDTPVLSYIHELPKLLESHPDELSLIRDRATTIIGGSEAVRIALRDTFHMPSERLEMVPGFIDETTEITSFEGKCEAKEQVGIPAHVLVVAACGVMHWRKSPKLFIEVAEKVLARTDLPVQFVWVGGGEDHEECQALVDELGLSERVLITGYEPDVQRYLNAADIFLLPSEEDPFPLVCLMAAQAQSPVVCFDDAGGMPEFVSQGCGVTAPYLDADAMAEATLKYLQDGDLRLEHGRTGQKIVRDKYTIRGAGPRLFALTRDAANLRPAVSVVMPNYNYEAYLPERLKTIANQTFQDFEIILLDDASPDGSVTVLEAWAKGRPATRLVVNKTNSGSPFAQWIRGMEMAKSDLIWITEADDFCEPNLLETLLPAFADRNVFLGYVKSVPVNSEGEIQGDYEELYLDRINQGRWSESYVVSDHEEASLGLGIANCIPNGSSVIFRKFDVDEGFRKQVTSMRMCGDWLFYLRAMRGGLVAYEQDPLNYHRRHGNTVTSKTEGEPMYFGELQSVRNYVQDHYRLSLDAQEKIQAFTVQDLDRFSISDEVQRDEILSGVARFTAGKSIPSVLFVASDLSPGGGQMFMLRLANAWAALGGRAILLNVGYSPTHPKVLSLIDSRITLIREWDEQAKDLAGLCTRFDIDVIHSSIWWADKYVRNQIDNLPHMPWITSMHGCHETHLADSGIDPDFYDDFTFMLGRMDEMVYTAQKNRAVFAEIGTPAHYRRIRNGVPISYETSLDRPTLGLRKTAVVLCLATRAIESKGWFAAVEMVAQLNAEGIRVDLMLIGEGPARDEISAAAPKHVHLYGHVDNLRDYIAVCDIGILPSFFVGESMPLVLLEMMGLGKPVVATDVGEIPDMIGTGNDAGGILVPLIDGALDIPAFVDALRCLAKSKRQRTETGLAAKARFLSRYSEEDMLEKYAVVYKEVIDRRALLSSRGGSR